MVAPLPLLHSVPHSAGVARPGVALPAGACDSHMHIFDPRFPPSTHWKRQPPDAPVAAYRQLQARIGTQRAVVVTPSTYGTDNACTLDALAQMGEAARGVAVVEAGVDAAELQRLHGLGVRGLRVNFVTPQSWGTTTPDMLATLAAKVAPLGWHIQVFVHPEQLLAMAGLLRGLSVALVVDHMARLDPAQGANGEAFDLLCRLLDGGNTWVKLSGAYMRSAVGGPGYDDTVAAGQALVRRAPERLVWGSDWPHTTETPGSVDDAALVDLLGRWCEGDAARIARIVVHNPAKLYDFGPLPFT
ncbi:amidohydrolase family protein [Pseudacidovorax intermedius]|uniref:2-pyrone-4,6-dicarboxylate hydrolase n=1 Tax=Pseudacidovorax intermedius TaxID=433924 RepID=A0A147GSM4_9BURK|nr:amidohydrolase family protein [Pseudacidovorax intermedius]KTT20587.1 2-pyrone-4,6-dicarboxylate hydrolase [Pseudacidovorax intermedius]